MTLVLPGLASIAPLSAPELCKKTLMDQGSNFVQKFESLHRPKYGICVHSSINPPLRVAYRLRRRCAPVRSISRKHLSVRSEGYLVAVCVTQRTPETASNRFELRSKELCLADCHECDMIRSSKKSTFAPRKSLHGLTNENQCAQRARNRLREKHALRYGSAFFADKIKAAHAEPFIGAFLTGRRATVGIRS